MSHENRRAAQAEAFRSLRILAGGIPVGTSRAGMECPFCRGGRTGERSFSLSRTSEAEAKYICFRASCGRHGRLATYGFRLEPVRPDGGNAQLRRREFTPKLYDGATRALGEQWLSYLGERFGLFEPLLAEFAWCEDVERGHLVCPIWDRRKVRMGTELRKFPLPVPVAGPKTLHYFEQDVSKISWFHHSCLPASELQVLVEDSISAIRVSRQFVAISLLGSHINLERLEPVLEVGRPIVIALDADATQKAFKFQKQFGLLGDIRVAVLERDLKYESDQRIKEIIDHAV